VLALAVTFVRLGVWQIDRLEERQAENLSGEQRFSADPTALEELGGSPEDLAYSRVVATGTFDPEHEVLIRSQVYLDTAGFDVITPLVGERGGAVLVNRGWVPLDMDRVPVAAAPPPSGLVTIVGWVHPTQTKTAFGPTDPAQGRLSTLSRVDVARISDQVPYPLEPFYLVEIRQSDEKLPAAKAPPRFDDEGPHLAYAIQWFGFAAIGLIGYGFWLRRSLSRAGPRD
jgi:surfeit locus 1 family protein